MHYFLCLWIIFPWVRNCNFKSHKKARKCITFKECLIFWLFLYYFRDPWKHLGFCLETLIRQRGNNPSVFYTLLQPVLRVGRGWPDAAGSVVGESQKLLLALLLTGALTPCPLVLVDPCFVGTEHGELSHLAAQGQLAGPRTRLQSCRICHRWRDAYWKIKKLTNNQYSIISWRDKWCQSPIWSNQS